MSETTPPYRDEMLQTVRRLEGGLKKGFWIVWFFIFLYPGSRFGDADGKKRAGSGQTSPAPLPGVEGLG
jgi:hypothetical protein